MTADLIALRERIAAIAARGPRVAESVRRGPSNPWARLPANCVEEETPYGPVAARREWLRDGADRQVASLSTCLGFAPDDLRRPLFLDTETTGLMGGTGTVAFMVGLAWRESISSMRHSSRPQSVTSWPARARWIASAVPQLPAPRTAAL